MHLILIPFLWICKYIVVVSSAGLDGIELRVSLYENCLSYIQVGLMGMTTAIPMYFMLRNQYLPLIFSGTEYVSSWRAVLLLAFSVGTTAGSFLGAIGPSPHVKDFPLEIELLLLMTSTALGILIFILIPQMTSNCTNILIACSTLFAILGASRALFGNSLDHIQAYFPASFSRSLYRGARVSDILISASYMIAAYSAHAEPQSLLEYCDFVPTNTSNTTHPDTQALIKSSETGFIVTGGCLVVLTLLGMAAFYFLSKSTIYIHFRDIHKQGRQVPLNPQVSVAPAPQVEIRDASEFDGLDREIKAPQEPQSAHGRGRRLRSSISMSHIIISPSGPLYSLSLLLIYALWACFITAVYPNVNCFASNQSIQYLSLPLAFMIDSLSRYIGRTISKFAFFKPVRYRKLYPYLPFVAILYVPIFFMCNFYQGSCNSLIERLPGWMIYDSIYLISVMTFGLVHGFISIALPRDFCHSFQPGSLEEENSSRLMSLMTYIGTAIGSAVAVIITWSNIS